MSTRNTRRRNATSPAAVQTNLQSPGLRANRRFLQPGRMNEGVRTARALEQALGIGSQFAGMQAGIRAEEVSLHGQRAALEGREPTEEEKKDDAWMLAFEAVITDREVIELEAGAVDLVQGMDTRNMNSDQVAAALDAYFQKEYENVDLDDDLNRAHMQRVMSRWEQTTAELLQQHQRDVAMMVQQDVEAGLSLGLEDEILRTNTLDLQSLNDKYVPLFGAPNANSELVNDITVYAIRNGRPDLVEKLQDTKKWGNGSAGPGSVDELAGVLNNARIQAESRRRELEAKADSAAEQEAKQWSREVETSLVAAAIEGSDITADLLGFLEDGFDPAKARVLVNFQRSLAGEAESATVDWDALTDLQERMYTTEFDLTDGLREITDMGARGALGSGEAKLRLLDRMFGELQSLENARKTDPLVNAQLGLLEADYRGDAISERLDPGYQSTRQRARAEFIELVTQRGMDAEMARAAVLESVPRYTPDAAGSGSSRGATFNMVRTGKVSASELLQYRPEGVSLADYIRTLQDESGYNFTAAQIRQLMESSDE